MRFLVSCGGTGGHMFPALSLIRHFQKINSNAEIAVVVTKRNLATADIDCEKFALSLAPLRLNFSLRNLCAVLNLIKGAFESASILFKFRPDVVIGFGGYASFPLLFFASLCGKKTLIHEQNVTMGAANRLLLPMVNKVCVSFPETKDALKKYVGKISLTGNPLRPGLSKIDKEEALRYFQLSSQKFTILVMGGSQGSQKINSEFLKALALVKDKSKFQIIHLSGKPDYDYLKAQYSACGVEVRLYDFLKEMSYAYSSADLVISRAGAITISELAFFAKPAIVVPYPFARQHQKENALALGKEGGCVIIDEKELNPESLAQNLERLEKDRLGLKQMSDKVRDLFTSGASENLAREVLSLAGG